MKFADGNTDVTSPLLIPFIQFVSHTRTTHRGLCMETHIDAKLSQRTVQHHNLFRRRITTLGKYGVRITREEVVCRRSRTIGRTKGQEPLEDVLRPEYSLQHLVTVTLQ
jgi:hypothetical protein